MIERYERDNGNRYFNILEIVIVWLIDEFHILLGMGGFYDSDSDSYNIRKMILSVLFGFGIVIVIAPFYMAVALFLYGNMR